LQLQHKLLLVRLLPKIAITLSRGLSSRVAGCQYAPVILTRF
jgi:hypothetical protein